MHAAAASATVFAQTAAHVGPAVGPAAPGPAPEQAAGSGYAAHQRLWRAGAPRPGPADRVRFGDYRYIGGFYGACSEPEMRAELFHKGPIAATIFVRRPAKTTRAHACALLARHPLPPTQPGRAPTRCATTVAACLRTTSPTPRGPGRRTVPGRRWRGRRRARTRTRRETWLPRRCGGRTRRSRGGLALEQNRGTTATCWSTGMSGRRRPTVCWSSAGAFPAAESPTGVRVRRPALQGSGAHPPHRPHRLHPLPPTSCTQRVGSPMGVWPPFAPAAGAWEAVLTPAMPYAPCAWGCRA